MLGTPSRFEKCKEYDFLSNERDSNSEPTSVWCLYDGVTYFVNTNKLLSIFVVRCHVCLKESLVLCGALYVQKPC